MKLDDDIHNYYEQLVLEKIEMLGLRESKDEDFLADLCCLALNKLPPQYIRFEVDMSFYLSNKKHQQMAKNAEDAINFALEFLDNKA